MTDHLKATLGEEQPLGDLNGGLFEETTIVLYNTLGQQIATV
jgi:hypothetical protein